MATLLGGAACVDPASILPDLAAKSAPTLDKWWGKANSFTTGPGFTPGRGHLLLRLSDAAQLNFAVDHTLTFSGEDLAHVVTLAKVTTLKSECISPGAAADPAATYLVEVVDRRHLDGMVPLDVSYNVALADGSAFLPGTLASGTPWTWQEIVTDIAGTIGITDTLTIPFTPEGTPENLFYWGVESALRALCDVLTRIGCDLTYDPIVDAYGIVRLGAAQNTYLAAITAKRTWDGYSSNEVRGYYPERLRVRFIRHPIDQTQGYSSFYCEDIVLPALTGTKAGTVVQIDDDLTALGTSGTPTNSANLLVRATERANDWLRKRLYYDRPVLRAWRDFIPTAAGLGGYAVHTVMFDDRGGVMQTWAKQEPDKSLEAWRPLSNLPPWYPLPISSVGSGSGSGPGCDDPVSPVTFDCSQGQRTATVNQIGLQVVGGVISPVVCDTTSVPLGPCAVGNPYGTPYSTIIKICVNPPTITTPTTDYTINYADHIVHADGPSITVKLPAIDPGRPPAGDIFIIKNKNATAMTLDGDGPNINGAGTLSMAQWVGVRVYNDGTNWFTE